MSRRESGGHGCVNGRYGGESIGWKRDLERSSSEDNVDSGRRGLGQNLCH